MSRILILHASLGTGHRSAATALGAALGRREGVEVDTVDILDLGGGLLRTALSEGYRQASEKAPLLYKLLYESSDTGDADEAMGDSFWWSLLELPFLNRVAALVVDLKPDVILCTHPLPARVLDACAQRGRAAPPLFLVVTDFMAHSAWLASIASGYFLPSELTRAVLVARGASPQLLHVTGIPIDLQIMTPKSAAAMRQCYDLPLHRPLVTLFGGGLDPQRVRLMVTGLLESPTEATLVVVAGRNRALSETLADLTEGPRMALRRLDLIDYVDDLVVASDLIITKAGGLIVSEVLARARPLVIIDPLPGQEEWNADFVVGAGAGIQLRLPEMVGPAVRALLEQPLRMAMMAEQARRTGRPRAAHDIIERVLTGLAIESGGPPASAGINEPVGIDLTA